MAILHEDLTHRIRKCAFQVHTELGPGLLENAYESCLYWELCHEGLNVQRQGSLPVKYRGNLVECGYRLDLVVENAVVIELKAIEAILPIHEAQLLTYMRLSGYRVGLLINFNVERLVDGIVRRVL